MANVAAASRGTGRTTAGAGAGGTGGVNMQDLRDAVVTALIEEQLAGADLSVMVADSTSTSKIAPLSRLIRSVW
ncbi:hypothetical protein M8494_08650 [Serratia ureilytica]